MVVNEPPPPNAPQLPVPSDNTNAVPKDEPSRMPEQSNKDEKGDSLPDDYDKLVAMMRKANLIRDNRAGPATVYKNSFLGEELINWLVREKHLKRREALEVGQRLIEKFFGQTFKEHGSAFSPDRFYQLVEDDPSMPLNSGLSANTPPVFITNVAEFNDRLKTLLDPIYKQILSSDRRLVFCERLEECVQFNEYLVFAKETAQLDIGNATREERLAFFVNIYNIMLIHIMHKNGPPLTIWQRRKYFNFTYYSIGGHLYSLQSILNGILRGNRTGIGMLWKPFGKEDRRRPLIVDDGEPLAHFAVNNYTRSSPPLRTYSTQNVYEEMKEQTLEMLMTDEFLRVDRNKHVIHVSKLFKIYAEDFGDTPEDIVEWIADILPDGETKKALIQVYYSGKYTLHFLSMDFDPNIITATGA
jgi:hypothetical protein